MRNKTRSRLTILSAALLLFLGLFLLQDTISTLIAPKTAKPLSVIKPESVTAVTVEIDKKNSSLIKKNNEWLLVRDNVEYKADSPRIEQIIKDLTEMTKDEVVSTNKDKQKDLGIGPRKITLKSTDGTQTVYVGNPRGNKSLVRLNDEDTVFTTKNLDTIFLPEDYRNLSLGLIQEPGKVSAVTIAYDGLEINLQKNQDTWLVNGTAAALEQVNYFLMDLNTLRGSDATSDSTVRDSLSAPSVTVSVTEGSQKQATFYYKNENKMHATTSLSPLVYSFPSSSIEALKVDQNYFIPQEEIAPEEIIN